MVPRLTLAYRGTAYAGWQRQPNAMTVQQRLEEALERALGVSVRTVGAGRTDAGVHARGQVAHIVVQPGESPAWQTLPDKALVHATNRHLPPDIRVLTADRMPAEFHAQKSAISKIYSYRMIPTRVLSPLDSLFAAQVDPAVDLGLMRSAVGALVGRHDFSAFARSGGAHSDPHRRIFAADLRETDRGLILRVEGEGFLRGMVRSLVGTLLEVGLGKRRVIEFERLLGGGSRSLAGPTAPSQGLVLESVAYLRGVAE